MSTLTRADFRPSLVAIDEDASYPCLLRVSPSTWNGYECPLFTRETADKIMATLGERSFGEMVGRYDAATDAFLVNDEGNEEPSVFPAMPIGGVKYYAIGAYGWCWTETHFLCEARALMHLATPDIPTFYEHPGFVVIPLPDGNSLNVGTANQEYGYDVAMALDGTMVGTSVTLPLDASAPAVADYMTRIYRHHARLIPVAWPIYIRSATDLASLISALNAEGRAFHYDDEPADISSNATGKALFNADESAHLNALMTDCDAFGGVWKIMEDEPAQTCHKLIGVFGEDEGEVTK